MKAGALTPSVVSLNPARRPKDVSKYTIGFNGSLGRSLLDAEVKETAASEDGNEADFSHVYIGHSMGAWAAAQAAVEAGYAGAPSVLVLVAPAFVPTSSKTLSSPTNMLKVLAAAIRGIFTSLILALWRPLCRPLLAMVRVYRLSALQPHFLPPQKKTKALGSFCAFGSPQCVCPSTDTHHLIVVCFHTRTDALVPFSCLPLPPRDGVSLLSYALKAEPLHGRDGFHNWRDESYLA
jgi:hypothetical protein